MQNASKYIAECEGAMSLDIYVLLVKWQWLSLSKPWIMSSLIPVGSAKEQFKTHTSKENSKY